MRSSILVVLVSLVMSGPSIRAQAPSTEDVTFTHQIRQFVMRGDDTDKIDVTLTMSADAVIMTPKKKGAAALTIPYATISGMTYDRRSRVRKMFVGSRGIDRAEDHFLTIQFRPESGAGNFIEIEIGKNTAPRIMATLEARSGKRIERSAGS